MRTFLAIDLNDEIRHAYAELYERGRRYDGLRWVLPQNLHITLRFLGAIDPERTAPLASDVEAEIAHLVPFRMTIGAPGSFGPCDHPRVLWFGVGFGTRALRQLARQVERAARRSGFPKERRPWRPHLTVARNPRRVRMDGWQELAGDCKLAGLSQNVENVTLYSSTLRPGERPVYSPVWRLTLKTK